MEFMGTGMMGTLACGCCCLGVVIVVAVVGILGLRRKNAAVGGAGDTPGAPGRGSSTNARLTLMEEPLSRPEPETVQLRPLPRSVPAASPAPAPAAGRPPPVPDGTTPRPGPQPPAAPTGSSPKYIAPNPTFIPPADED